MNRLEFDRQTDRWHYIDLMEAMGILFVVIYHATTYKYSWLYGSSAIYTFRYYMRTFLSAGVPMVLCQDLVQVKMRFSSS